VYVAKRKLQLFCLSLFLYAVAVHTFHKVVDLTTCHITQTENRDDTVFLC